jgi:hypothetical protein
MLTLSPLQAVFEFLRPFWAFESLKSVGWFLIFLPASLRQVTAQKEDKFGLCKVEMDVDR